MRDYIAFYFNEPDGARWVTSNFIKGRRIALCGIGMGITAEGGKVSLDPMIPCVAGAMRLLKKNPLLEDIKFNRKKRKWVPA